MKVALLSKEYPPEVYGGAGVHVEHLGGALRNHVDLAVHCFGAPRPAEEVAATYQPWGRLKSSQPHLAALQALSVDLAMAAGVQDAQLVHSHTWYTNLAGHFAKLLFGIPHVMTTHSLEPLRPWKAEQLGGGYALSCFCERVAIEAADAVIAVSGGMRADILRAYPAVAPERVHVIHNGVDPEQHRPNPDPEVLRNNGVDPERPYVLFIGRITRQKGVVHLLNAARHFAAGVQLVLCAGEPDTVAIRNEVQHLVAELRRTRGQVIWIERMLPREELNPILSGASVFVCPSVYEPFGIVNLEAMACSVPVVASAVGGIPEVVQDGETGFLVSFESDGTPRGEPRDPQAFALALAEKVNAVLADASVAQRMGAQGRQTVIDRFSWSAIAERTAELYSRLVGPA